MKLSEWAQIQGVSYRTAWRWFKAGVLPVSARQLTNGTILIEAETPKRGEVAIYARVSPSDQKDDLDRQVARLVTFANEKGLSVSKTVAEIGSGLNARRSKLLRLLQDDKVETILVEHKDRLVRFGSEYIESALSSAHRKILVMDQKELNDDLVQDMIDVLTSFCARLYGRRSAKNRAKKAMRALSE